MSTRANIIIKVGETTVYLYRHCDGYPATLGGDLYEKLTAAWGTVNAHRTIEGTADRLLRAMLSEYYDAPSYDPTQHRSVYELTTGLHGDVEHVYTVEFKHRFNTGKMSICHAARPDDWFTSGLEIDDWSAHPTRYGLDQFRAMVNADRAACNARLMQLKAEQPGPYGNSEPFTMLEA